MGNKFMPVYDKEIDFPKKMKIIYNKDKLTLDLSCLNEKAQEVIFDILGSYITEYSHIVNGTQSPIEEMFAAALYTHMDGFYKKLELHGFDLIDVQPQQEFSNGIKRYFVDFYIVIFSDDLNKGYSFVVECDGHDFHEKTKEQAARDRKRERDLIKAGTTVIRLTGSEIYRDPSKSVREVLATIYSVLGIE